MANVGSYVWIIWSHCREGFVLEEIHGDFFGKKRCLNILKPWTDLSNLLFHSTQLPSNRPLPRQLHLQKVNTENHLMFLSLLQWWNLSQKKNVFYWFHHLGDYNLWVRLLFRNIPLESCFGVCFLGERGDVWMEKSWMVNGMVWKCESR